MNSIASAAGHQIAAPAAQLAQALEDAIVNERAPQVDCPVAHYFSKGLYAREISIPAGTVLVGATHRADSIAVLSKGRLRLSTDNGAVDIEAPHTRMCTAGSKNAALALEDSVWTNFFATSETDVDKLVEELTFSKASELLGGADNRQLLAAANSAIEGAV